MTLFIKLNLFINLIYLRLSDSAAVNGGYFGLFRIFFIPPGCIFASEEGKIPSRIQLEKAN